MLDAYGRKIEYLRISVTDRCNLRCTYCMPRDIELIPMSEILTYEEISRTVKIFTELGIRHIRLTGGEPLVRKEIETLAAMLAKVNGIETIGITTNGVLLQEKYAALKESGITSVNVSLDTLDPEAFFRITGKNSLGSVLRGIRKATEAGLPVKLNTVASPDTDEISLAEYASDADVTIRFIELMPIGAGKNLHGRDNRSIMTALSEKFGTPVQEGRSGPGPAVYYRYPGLRRPVGFISAIHGNFCSECNRVRLSSDGFLKLCLCYSDGIGLKELLRNGSSDEDIKRSVADAVFRKPAAHRFDDLSGITENKMMNRIGG